MQKEGHPKYNPLKVIISGDEFQTKSAGPDPVIHMDIDYRKHRAWTGVGIATISESNAKVTNFNAKFGNLNFGAKK